MITVNIGRTFLRAYNKKYDKELSAKEFFEEVFLEEFYNHPKYLMSGGNSPLENPKISWKKGERPSLENRQERINKTIEKIDSDAFDASIALGFPASDDDGFQPTSGLVTDIANRYKVEDKYYSWIGSGLSIGVAGGLSILFDQPEILLKTYEGWKVYREFLNDPTLEKLAGNKITSWNGQWLSYIFSKDYRDSFDFASLNNLGFFKHDNSGTVIETVKWSRLFFNLSQQFPEQTFTGYVFSFGQMNKTMGFFPFRFQQARKLITFYKKLFGENAVLEDSVYYENLYGIHIKRACEMGAFGMQALEPDGLRKYFEPDKMPNLSKQKANRGKEQSDEDFENAVKESDKKDYENKIIPFRIYKTWLLAMITKNKEEMSDYTREVAKAIYEYRAGDKKGSKKRSNIVSNQLFASKSKRGFLEALTEIISEVEDENLNLFNELRDRVHLMNNEDFGYFIVLLKFDYAYQERIS